MGTLPEFWRTEVFHPLSVHFPIALLLMAFIFAYTTAWFFTIALILDLSLYFLGQKISSYLVWINRLIVMLLLAGSGFLAYVGHLGATLVYQQAAGVYTPSEDCKEFE